MYTIKEMAELAGVSARTLRYYDTIDLLKPAYTNEAGYRFYGEREVDLLQQILFYRERGMDLQSIQNIIYKEDFNTLAAMEDHLKGLETKKKHIDSLICLVRRSILSMKGEEQMTDSEKFQAFKESVVRKHEEMYGAEARKEYGDEEIDAAQQKILNMSEEEYERFQSLGNEIKERLKEAVQNGISPESDEAGRSG